jgi:ribonuclease HI
MIEDNSINTSDFPILLYTDGACVNNGYENSKGGWGFILVWDRLLKEYRRAGFEKGTTNNRMEIISVLQGLSEVKTRWGNQEKGKVLVISDSQYTIYGASKWMYKWQIAGWKKTPNKKKGTRHPLLNTDLWKQMYDICKEINPTFIWVRGHTGNYYNELCDSLATTAISTQQDYYQAFRNIANSKGVTII